MRTTFKATLAFALAAAFTAPALAQQPRQPGGGFPGGGGFGFGGPTSLITNKSVQTELKMTEEQIKKAEELSTKTREKSRGLFRETDMEKRAAAMKEINEAATKEVNTILTSEQQKRLKQITIQEQGSRAFTSEDVQKSLNLTDEQKEAIKAIVENQRETILKAVAGKLTPEQKKAWQDLTGEKFEIKRERPGGGGTNPRPGGGRPGGGNRPGGGTNPQRPPRVDL